jgi:hypothetical protein
LGTSKKKRLRKKKISPEGDGTLRPIHNKRPNKLIIGTAINDLDNTFTACNHPGTKLDLDVTRVNPNISQSIISNYVNKKLVSKVDNCITPVIYQKLLNCIQGFQILVIIVHSKSP